MLLIYGWQALDAYACKAFARCGHTGGMVEVGSVADWVEAIATVGALTYVACQFRSDRRRIRALEEKEEQQSRQERDQQAHKVCTGLESDDSGSAAIVVTNYSDEPIRNVSLLVSLPDDDPASPAGQQVVPLTPLLGPRSRVRVDAPALLGYLREHQVAAIPERFAGPHLRDSEVLFRNSMCAAYSGRMFGRPERIELLRLLTDNELVDFPAIGEVREFPG
jgi:hypothetical protein